MDAVDGTLGVIQGYDDVTGSTLAGATFDLDRGFTKLSSTDVEADLLAYGTSLIQYCTVDGGRLRRCSTKTVCVCLKVA